MCFENQLTGFDMVLSLTFNELIEVVGILIAKAYPSKIKLNIIKLKIMYVQV